MIRTYTMRLKVTRKQDETLQRLLAQLCELYNMALQQRRDIYRQSATSIGRYEQHKQLTELRAGVKEYAEFPAAIQRDPINRLDRAFASFFRRCKCGDKPGFPRFRSEERYGSFSTDKQNFVLDNNGLSIVKLGKFRTRTHCKIRGTPLEVNIKRCGSKWQAKVVCEIGPAPEKVAVRSAVGIDLGLTSLATLSDGTEILNPRWTRREEDHLAEAGRFLSRKAKGSKNRLKAKERLRRVHQRIAGLRVAYLTGVAKQLIRQYDLIAHEDLNIRNMVQSRFSKSIMDAAWGQLIWRLQCEAEKAGKWVVPVNPRGTTQLCSGCGEMAPKSIRQREHYCPSCGLLLGRDHNAALNILDRGMRSVVSAA